MRRQKRFCKSFWHYLCSPECNLIPSPVTNNLTTGLRTEGPPKSPSLPPLFIPSLFSCHTDLLGFYFPWSHLTPSNFLQFFSSLKWPTFFPFEHIIVWGPVGEQPAFLMKLSLVPPPHQNKSFPPLISTECLTLSQHLQYTWASVSSTN